MKTFVERIKEYRDNYIMGFWSRSEAEDAALVDAVQYIGLKRWNVGYENIIRSLFPKGSRKVVKSVQPNGYDTDIWVDKVYFE